MLITTTPTIEGRPIQEYTGIVNGEAIMGANVVRDFLASITDVVGGRSGAYEGKLKQARDIAIEEMRQQAARLGANAIVGVDLDYEVVRDGMLMVTCRRNCRKDPMSFLHWLADEKIKLAIKDGEFDGLKGLGKPLELDDLSHIPEELRAAYRVLKNAGIVPEEVQLNKDIATLGSLLAMCGSGEERTSLQKELSAKRLRLQSLTGSRGWDHLQAFADYKDKIQARLEGEQRHER